MEDEVTPQQQGVDGMVTVDGKDYPVTFDHPPTDEDIDYVAGEIRKSLKTPAPAVEPMSPPLKDQRGPYSPAANSAVPKVTPADQRGPYSPEANKRANVSAPYIDSMESDLKKQFGRVDRWADRNVAGTNKKSEHAFGRALDVFDVKDHQAIIAKAQADPKVSNIIFDGQIWNRKTNAWKPYKGVNPHKDHVHIGYGYEQDQKPDPRYDPMAQLPNRAKAPVPGLPAKPVNPFIKIGDALVKQTVSDRAKAESEKYDRLPFSVEGFKNSLARGLSGVRLKNGQQIRLDQAMQIWQERTGEKVPSVQGFTDVSSGAYTVPQEAIDIGSYLGGKGGTIGGLHADRAQRGEQQPRNFTEYLTPIADVIGEIAHVASDYAPMQKERKIAWSAIETALNAVGIDTPKETASYFRPAITIAAGLLDFPIIGGARFVKNPKTFVTKNVHDAEHMGDALLSALDPDSNISFEERTGTLAMTALAAMGAVHGVGKARAFAETKFPELTKVKGWQAELDRMTGAINSIPELDRAIRQEQWRQKRAAEFRDEAAILAGNEPSVVKVSEPTAATVASEPAPVPGQPKKPKNPKATTVEPQPMPETEGPVIPVEVGPVNEGIPTPPKRKWKGTGLDPVEVSRSEWEQWHFDDAKKASLDLIELERQWIIDNNETIRGERLKDERAKQRELDKLNKEQASVEALQRDPNTPIVDELDRSHETYITENVKRGRYVSDTALADYPQLAEQYRQKHVPKEPSTVQPIPEPEAVPEPVMTEPTFKPTPVVEPTPEVTPEPLIRNHWKDVDRIPEHLRTGKPYEGGVIEHVREMPEGGWEIAVRHEDGSVSEHVTDGVPVPHETTRAAWEKASFEADKAREIKAIEDQIAILKADGAKESSAAVKKLRKQQREIANEDIAVFYADENGDTHLDHVERAIAEGKDVPPEVRAEYADELKSRKRMESKARNNTTGGGPTSPNDLRSKQKKQKLIHRMIRDIKNVGKTIGVQSWFESKMKPGIAGFYETPSKKHPFGRIKIGAGFRDMSAIETVAHEVSHALDSFLMTENKKRGPRTTPISSVPQNERPKGDLRVLLNATPEEAKVFKDELRQITIALEGADVVNDDPRYFLQPVETWARFMEAAISGKGGLLFDKAPNAWKRLQEMRTQFPEVDQLLKIGEEVAIDKSPFMIGGHDFGMWFPDRKQEWIKATGSRLLGLKVFENMIVWDRKRNKFAYEAEKLIESKFNGVNDDAGDLFDAAEGVLSYDSTTGEMKFGTRDRAIIDPKDASYDMDVELAKDNGWTLDAIDDKGREVWSFWRYDPATAEANYDLLSDAGKKVIREYTDAAANANDVFNRNLLADTYGISKSIEGYVHHVADLKALKGMPGGQAILRERIASARKMRENSTPPMRDLAGATRKVIAELALEQPFNEMVHKTFSAIAEPLPSDEAPRPGWVKVYGSPKGGWYAEGNKPYIMTADKTVPMNLTAYEIPEGAHKMFLRELKAAEDINVFGRTMNSITRLWKGNALLSPASVMTNLLSGSVMYGTYMAKNMYLDLFEGFSGQFKNRTLRSSTAIAKATLNALYPGKGFRNSPDFDWMFGGDASTQTEMFRKMEGVGNGLPGAQKLHDIQDGLLESYQKVERFWKRVIVDSEKNIHNPADLTDPKFLLDLQETLDVFTLDYQNVPTWLKTVRESSLGSAAAPFVTYPYKITKTYMNLIGGAFDTNLPPKERAAKILALSSIVAAQMAIKNAISERGGQTTNLPPGPNDPANFDNSKLPSAVNAHGWTFAGEYEGSEVFVKTSKYPFIEIGDAIQAFTRRDTDAMFNIWSDHIGQLGPAGEFALASMGYSDKYAQYKDTGTRMGEWMSSFVPGSRILSGVSKAVDPKAREIPDSFAGVFGQMIPFANDLHGEVRAVKVPMLMPWQSKKGLNKDSVLRKGGLWYEVPKQSWQDAFFREVLGLPVKRVNKQMWDRLKMNQAYYDMVPDKPERPYDPLQPPK